MLKKFKKKDILNSYQLIKQLFYKIIYFFHFLMFKINMIVV
jgi:hypothetical protein